VGAVVSAVRQIEAPTAVRSLSTLARVDYADTFVVELDGVAERTAEQWARAVLEDAPLPVRGQLVSGWTALGLKVGTGRSGVLGWSIRSATADAVLLGADSRNGMPGELLFKREPRGLVFATFVQHGNPVARALWARVERVHVATVRRLLEALLPD
jgi:hypothetical protein